MTHRDRGEGQALTLLGQRIAEMRMTLEEFAEYAERFGREHKEPGTLSLRHLQRLVTGRRGDGRPLGAVRPATARLLERICDGDSITDLLAPPPPGNRPADSADVGSSVLLPVVVDGQPVFVPVDADTLAAGGLSAHITEQVGAASAMPAGDGGETRPGSQMKCADFSGSPDLPDEFAMLFEADPALFDAITSGATVLGNDINEQLNIWRPVMDALKRRGLLSIFGVTTVGAFIPQLLGVDPDAQERLVAHVTTDQAQQIRQLVPEIHALDRQMGGDGLRHAALWCLRKVDLLLNRANYSEPAGRELQSAYGELAELAGWLHFDAGRYEQAQFFYGEALRAAQLADDLSLEVHTLASTHILSRYRDRPREGIQLIQLAQHRATGWATPRLAALLATREAAGWAQLGEATASRKAMHRAYHTFHPDAQDDDPAWISFFDSAELSAASATASSYLGQVDRAIAAEQSAVDGLSAKCQRNRALYSVRLGISLLDARDQVRACEVVQPVLPLFNEVRSVRTHAHLGKFLNSLQDSAGPVARDLLDYAHTLGIPTIAT